MKNTTKAPKMTKTQQVVAAMLTEKVSHNMCDSGGINGRAYQQNQKRSFIDEPQGKLDCSYGSLGLTLSTFHFLTQKLSYDAKMQAKFNRFAKTKDQKDENWFTVVENWVEKLNGTGIYNEGEPIVVNTYNNENLLDQVVQYTYFTLEDDNQEYVALMVHGGADVRGGYTAPKIFICNDELSILDNNRATVYSEKKEDSQLSFELDSYLSEDSLRWFFDGGSRLEQEDTDKVKDLNEYEIITQKKLEALNDDLEAEDDLLTPKDFIGKGVIFVDENGIAYCPVFGTPLQVFSY